MEKGCRKPVLAVCTKQVIQWKAVTVDCTFGRDMAKDRLHFIFILWKKFLEEVFVPLPQVCLLVEPGYRNFPGENGVWGKGVGGGWGRKGAPLN